MKSRLSRGDGGKLKWVSRFLFIAAIFLLMAQPTQPLEDKALLIYQSRKGDAHYVVPMVTPGLTLRYLEGPKIFSKGEVLRCSFKKGQIEVIGLDKVVTQLHADILVCGESKFVIIGISLAH